MNPPTTCPYCEDHVGRASADPDDYNECGFCNNGKPLDTQADWDATWGRILTESR